jgi:two-component system response regulator FixJ
MADYSRQHIFFVDDEPKIRKVVGRTLEQLGAKVSCFACAADCLEQLRSQTCDLLVTDVKMPGMDGIELLIKAKRIAPWLSVLVITGYGDVPMAVRALKAGASDFIEKPLERQSFLSTVESVLKRTTPPDPLLGSSLTQAEMKVLRFILDGNSNKETARLLNRSVRTIEDHRSHIMRKLGVDNLADLVKRATAVGLVHIEGE